MAWFGKPSHKESVEKIESMAVGLYLKETPSEVSGAAYHLKAERPDSHLRFLVFHLRQRLWPVRLE